MQEWFRRVSARVSEITGTPWAFILAIAVILVWALTGPFFHFSDTWQLVVNTGTTIVTFLMVFLIQNTQNRDAKALHLKLDELIRATQNARNSLVDLENCTDAELEQLQQAFKRIGQRAPAVAECAQEIEQEIQTLQDVLEEQEAAYPPLRRAA